MNRTSWLLLAVLAAAIVSASVYYGFIHDERAESQLAWKNRDAEMEKLETRLKDLVDQMRAVQGKSRCDGDSQCRIVGLGAQTCGLHKDFLIYSTKDADESSLLRIVSEFNKSHERLSEMTLAANGCGKKPAPIACKNFECTPVME